MKTRKSKLFCIIFALVLLLTAFTGYTASGASENALPVVESTDGMTFTADPSYKSSKPLSDTPNTFEATVWFPKTFGTTTRGGVIVGSYGQDTPSFNIEITAGGYPRFYWVDSKGTIDKKFTGVNVIKGEWVTLTIVRDTAKSKLFCYVDGALSETLDLPASDDIKIKTPFSIGGDLRGGNSVYFRGKLKNVALYSDVRTAEEVAADYSNPGYDKSGLLAFYALNEEDKASLITDSTGNYNMKLYYQWLDESPTNEEYAYSFAVVGDTQIMNRAYPTGFVGIYDWILSNVESKKIKCVIGLGDITDSDNDEEWQRAVEQTERMNGVVPFTMVIGNHDTVSQFNKYMKNDANLAQIEGTYDGGVENAWRTLKVGDTDYLILILEYGPRDAVLNWASGIIEDHPNHRVIVTTHCYLYRDGTTLDGEDVCPPSGNGVHPERNDGDDMWDKFVSKHENIVMVLSGHDPSAPIVMTPAVGDNGNTVCQFLIDPQEVDRNTANGTGLVALFCFSEDGNRCRVEYYSTVKKRFYLSQSQFIFDLRTGEIVDSLYSEDAPLVGDTDGNGRRNANDALHLLYAYYFPDKYTVKYKTDINGDGDFDTNDAIYLLYYIYFPKIYPIK